MITAMTRSPRTPVTRSPDVLAGTPVFTGTRVPVLTFFEYIEAGQGIDDFLVDFPSVKRSQALEVLRSASQ